jgi:hypothetical protein
MFQEAVSSVPAATWRYRNVSKKNPLCLNYPVSGQAGAGCMKHRLSAGGISAEPNREVPSSRRVQSQRRPLPEGEEDGDGKQQFSNSEAS